MPIRPVPPPHGTHNTLTHIHKHEQTATSSSTSRCPPPRPKRTRPTAAPPAAAAGSGSSSTTSSCSPPSWRTPWASSPRGRSPASSSTAHETASPRPAAAGTDFFTPQHRARQQPTSHPPSLRARRSPAPPRGPAPSRPFPPTSCRCVLCLWIASSFLSFCLWMAAHASVWRDRCRSAHVNCMVG